MKEFEVVRYFEDGDTNDVFLTDKDTVVKKFSRFSVPSVVISIAYTFTGHIRFFTRSNRIESERKVRKIDQDSLNFPDIISSDERFMEFEYIEGTTFKQKAQDPENCRDIGKELGEILSDLENKNLFLIDYFLDNFIETDRGLYHIDPEYAGFENSRGNELMDVLSILLTLKLLPMKNYRQALKGFESVRGKTSLFEMFMANFVSLLYAGTLGSKTEFLNTVKNLKRR